MAPVRRDVLAMGAAATAMAATSGVFAQTSAGEVKNGFYEKGKVRIRYQEVGSGFPLLATPGGGLNSKIAAWPTAVINVMEHFKNDFRVITMDQRNAAGGESTGPIPVDNPWDAFADDQLGLMTHLGIDKFFYFGNCIGGGFGLKLMERAPQRVVASVLSQPFGNLPEKPDILVELSRNSWGAEYRKNNPNVSAETIEKYLHNLFRVRPDFVYAVSRESVRTIQTPILVLPDSIDFHPYQISVDIASLAPNADFNVYPWKDPPELKARTINRVRKFLKAHQPA